MRHPPRSQKSASLRPHHKLSARAVVAPSRQGIGQRVHDILARKQLTLSQVSQASKQLFRGENRYHISHDLYSDLRTEAFTPSIHQLFALSSISGYRLIDWLDVFEFSLDDIPRLQSALPFIRTILLPSTIYDPTLEIPWFEEKRPPKREMGIIPVAQFLEPSGSVPVGALQKLNRTSFRYARVGQFDTFAFPELLPGSIVRVDPRIRDTPTETLGHPPFFLVQHARGLNCCQLQHISPDRVAILSRELSHPRIELRLGAEIRILGMLDMEIRSVLRVKQPDTRQPFPRSNIHTLIGHLPADTLGDLLRRGRVRAGLSFRQASALSKRISEELADTRYFAAAGSLSDYEATNIPPRHVQKVLTLCTLYSIDFWKFVKAAGLPVDKLGIDPMRPNLTPANIPRSPSEQSEKPRLGPFFQDLWAQMEEIPFFLRQALPHLSGLDPMSLRDVFWVENARTDFPPILKGVRFMIINRRTKTPAPTRWAPAWKQPLYLLLRRDGSYFCGSFALNDGKAILQSTCGSDESKLAHPDSDVEVVGQIVALVRRLS